MLLYLDNKNRIMAVNSTDRTDLKEIKVDETAEMFPFTGWSDVRICCYKIGYDYPQIGTEEQLSVGGEIMDVPIYSEYATITMMTPYVPTHMMSAIERLDRKNSILKATQEENDTELLYQVCLLQLGITEDDI